MKGLFTRGVIFMVAPYESDSQIAHLVKTNVADVAISEDSDLLTYNINVIFKLNQDGDCDYINL